MDINWQGSVDIDAPVEEVYAYLADFPRHCEWAQSLERMELRKPGAEHGVGAVYKTYERQAFQTDRLPHAPVLEDAVKGTTECEVTQLVPNQHIAWRAHPLPVGMGVYANLAFDLVLTSDGGTQLTQTIHMHQPWLMVHGLFRIWLKLKPEEIDAKVRAQWQASLDNIKTVLDAAPA